MCRGWLCQPEIIPLEPDLGNSSVGKREDVRLVFERPFPGGSGLFFGNGPFDRGPNDYFLNAQKDAQGEGKS